MKKKNKKIIQGGLQLLNNPHSIPDVILQQPELFLFDLQKYMSSVQAARSIDYSMRTQLYDMYESATLDLHFGGVFDKRLRGATSFPIEFRKDGKADDIITPQLKSPWFKELRKEIIKTSFWGFSLLQFYTDSEGNIRYQTIDRKHYDPIRKIVKKYQDSLDGKPIEEFEDTLFLGDERSLGIMAEIMPAILYKRGNISDWAKFCNIFGIPIREYTYDANDEVARKRLIADAKNQGANAVYIHPKESSLNIIEAGNKSGSSELYSSFTKYWDREISIRVLGNTLTTDSQSTGTQALGTVHKEEEEDMNLDDRETILDTLNYFMRPIFESLGFNVEGGEFVYAHKEKIDPVQQTDIILKLNSIGLPIDDDYLYEYSGIPKPQNYEQIKKEKQQEKEYIAQQYLNNPNNETEEEPPTQRKKKQNKSLNFLKRFFYTAPQIRGADNEF